MIPSRAQQGARPFGCAADVGTRHCAAICDDRGYRNWVAIMVRFDHVRRYALGELADPAVRKFCNLLNQRIEATGGCAIGTPVGAQVRAQVSHWEIVSVMNHVVPA